MPTKSSEPNTSRSPTHASNVTSPHSSSKLTWTTASSFMCIALPVRWNHVRRYGVRTFHVATTPSASSATVSAASRRIVQRPFEMEVLMTDLPIANYSEEASGAGAVAPKGNNSTVRPFSRNVTVEILRRSAAGSGGFCDQLLPNDERRRDHPRVGIMDRPKQVPRGVNGGGYMCPRAIGMCAEQSSNFALSDARIWRSHAGNGPFVRR